MTTRNLLSGPITLSAATFGDRNILHTLSYPERKEAFYKRIDSYRPLLVDAVAHHLNVKAVDVFISPEEYWRHGSFNLCVPIMVDIEQYTDPSIPQFVMLRFPLPYRVGELTNPGNSDEKLNCEAATYAWLQENCPDVPIPRLYGFGLSTNQRFSRVEFLPWWWRWFEQIRRGMLAVFGFQQPSQYVCRRPSHFAGLDIAYLLIQTITDGEMLSKSWDEKHGDEKLQENLQRSLARIMVSLARVPLPRIGSFRLDDGGYLRLDNRPLSIQVTILENEGISSDLARDTTFSTSDEFILHHVHVLDNRLLCQPNAITSRDDACYQMTSLAAARSVFPRLLRRDLCKGPFAFQFADLHRSNIFVDDSWNITSIIDLEFAGSFPPEFLQTPYWLTGKAIDEIDPVEFEPIHCKFLEHLRREEQPRRGKDDTEPLSSVIQQAWETGAFWLSVAITDSITFTSTFYDRILPDFFSLSEEESNKADYWFFARLWRPGVRDIIAKKLKDREEYLDRLKAAFAEGE